MAYDNLYGRQPQAPGVRVPDIFQMFSAAIGGMQAAQQMRHFEAKLPHELAQMDATADNTRADTRYKTTTVDWLDYIRPQMKKWIAEHPEFFGDLMGVPTERPQAPAPTARSWEDDYMSQPQNRMEPEQRFDGLRLKPYRPSDNLFGPRGY